MGIPKKTYIDSVAEKRVKLLIYAIGILTILPSIYLGYGIVKDTITESSINTFIEKEFIFENTRVLNKYLDSANNTLEVIVFGSRINADSVEVLNNKLSQYKLDNLNLRITQSDTPTSLGQDDVKRIINEELYQNNQIALGDRDKKIELLENELYKYKLNYEFDVKGLYNEIRTLYPEITDLSIGRAKTFKSQNEEMKEIIIATINASHELPIEDLSKIKEWFKTKTNNPDVELFTNYAVPIAPLSLPESTGVSEVLPNEIIGKSNTSSTLGKM